MYLETLRPNFSRLLAFVPTGWSHRSGRASLSALRPKTAGPVSIYSRYFSIDLCITVLLGL